MDELVREYLLFRGFTSTLKSFDADLKTEKEKGFRVDKIVDQISQHISSHDLPGLLDLWKHFDTKLFSRLDTQKAAGVKKLENSVYKFYVVSCVQSKLQDKVKEFFERMTPDLHGQTEWKDWFALPYIKDPADNPAFALYFSRQWQDTLTLSLTNFLSLVFHALPPPRLADYQKTASRIRLMREEIKRLKMKLAAADLDLDPQLCQGNIKTLCPPPTKENMDDFFLIAQEAAVVENQTKSLKTFLRNITGGGSSSSSGERKRSPATKSRSSSKTRQTLLGSSSSSSSVLSSSVPVVNSKQLNRASQSSITSADLLPVVVCNNITNNSSNSSIIPTTTMSKPNTSTTTEPETMHHTKKYVNDEEGTTKDSKNYLLLGQDSYTEHRSEVTSMRVSSAGDRIVSVDKSGVIKVWSVTPAPATLATFISGNTVTCVCWVEASEKYFLYGTSAGQVRLCDVQEKMSIAEVSPELLSGSPVSVLESGPSPATFLLCAGIKILLMDTVHCRLERDLSHPSLNPVTCAQFNHNGSVLIHAGADGKLGMTDLHRGELLCVWSVHSAPVTSIRLNNDQTGVWSMAEDAVLAFSNIVRSNEKVWESGARSAPAVTTRPVFSMSSDCDHVLTNESGAASLIKLSPVPGANTDLETVLTLSSGDQGPVTTSVLWCTGDCSPALTGDNTGNIVIYTLLRQ